MKTPVAATQVSKPVAVEGPQARGAGRSILRRSATLSSEVVRQGIGSSLVGLGLPSGAAAPGTCLAMAVLASEARRPEQGRTGRPRGGRPRAGAWLGARAGRPTSAKG